MVSQAELISKSYQSLVHGFIFTSIICISSNVELEDNDVMMPFQNSRCHVQKQTRQLDRQTDGRTDRPG